MKEFDKKLFYNPEEFRNKAIYNNGFDEGFDKGKLEMVESLIKEMPDINIDTLMKVTYLTKEEIESLQKEINSKKND